MTCIFAKKALLEQGWANNVRLGISDGCLQAVDRDESAQSGDERVDILIPGMANAHSHAFQRVLAGHTEKPALSGQDNFWSWRTRMYHLVERMDAKSLRVVARQLYTEMLGNGYTSVAEFHYLHHQPRSNKRFSEMFEALCRAADESGIRLTYVPVLYQRAGFDQPKPTAAQQRFCSSLQEFVAHYERAKAVFAESAGRHSVAIGAHSLRAVDAQSLTGLAQIARRDGCPFHIHIAEQEKEVADCLEVLGQRPVDYLLETCSVDANWCLVHATHLEAAELNALVKTGALVCLCPSTEANLGDGLFALKPWLEQGGGFAIGSDSHVGLNPFEELRWLEYGQRLVSQSRNVATIDGLSTGYSLFNAAVEGGARACGNGDGQLREGGAADLVCLNADHPVLAGHDTDSLLDALVFTGASLPIERVMVAGHWRVVDGKHLSQEISQREYATLVRKIGPVQDGCE